MNKKLKRFGYGVAALAVTFGASGVLGRTSVYADSPNCSAEPAGDSCVAGDITDLTAGINNEAITNITLTGDIDTDVEIPIHRNLTLDLGGHALNAIANKHTIKVYNDARLVLSNGSVKGNNGYSALFNNGIVEANNVNFTINETASSKFYVITNHGEMELNDCTAKRTTSGAASVVENGYADYGNKTGKAAGEAKGYVEGENGQYPSLVINGGDYTVISGGGVEVIKTDDGADTYINDGEFTSDENTTGWLLQLSGRSLNITGGTFTSKDPSVGDIIAHYCQGDAVNTCSLNISGGTFNAPQNLIDSVDGSIANATISISGGTFRNDQVANYLAEGYDLYDLSTDEETRFVVLGGIDVEPIESDDADSDADRTVIEDFVSAQIEAVVKDKAYELDEDGILADTGNAIIVLDDLLDALAEGQEISVSYEQYDGDIASFLEDGDEEVLASVRAAAGNAELGAMFYAEVWIYAGENPIGYVYDLGDDQNITVTYELSEELANAPEGYIRNFYIIRLHDDVAEKFAATRSGNKISVDNNKFSAFIVAYEDVKDNSRADENPNTFDRGALAFSIVGGSSVAITVLGAVILSKKQ